MTLVGKTIVVTGGASGIGLAIVQKLLQMSASVHCIDKSDSTSTHLSDQKGKLFFYPSVDISVRGQVTQIFNEIAQKDGTIYGLVNCAGIVKQHPTEPESDADFKQVLDVNLIGTWNATTEFISLVKMTRGTNRITNTSIVNIGSTASFRGFQGIPGYVASKHAVHGLTKAWAQEFGSLGTRVNMVAPGVVATPMTKVDGSGNADDLTGIPCAMNRVAQPEEIADVVYYLLSSSSSYVNGQGIEVNGGWL